MASRKDDTPTEPVNEAMGETNPVSKQDQILEMLTTAVSLLAAKVEAGGGSTRTDELMEKLTGALIRLGEGAEATALETKRAHRRSNDVVPLRSVFNRRGMMLDPNDPQHNRLQDGRFAPFKPPLKCLMMMPWMVEWESCTREEVELLNLLQPGDYEMKRIDNSKVRVSIKAEYKADGKTMTRLTVHHDTAFNRDNFRNIPPFADFLRQYLRQHDDRDIVRAARMVITDEEEEALIEAGELTVSV